MADAEALFKAFSKACKALGSADVNKKRVLAMTEIQSFMGDHKRRARVHRWRGWGLLFSNLFKLIEGNVFEYLGVSVVSEASIGKKSKKKPSTTSKNLRLDWWGYARQEFASAHQVDGPTLHLDPNGRECVNQLFAFALSVIDCEGATTKDPDAWSVRGRIERAAWESIRLVVHHRVYCAVLDKKRLQEVLEIALATIDHNAKPQSSFPKPLQDKESTDALLLVSVVRLVLENSPYDTHDWLTTLIPFLARWITHADRSNSDVSSMIIDTVTAIGNQYFTFAGPLVLMHGIPLLQFIRRSWNSMRLHQQSKLAEFVTMYIAMFDYHTDSLELNLAELLREAKSLLQIALDSRLLQSLRLTPRLTTMASVSSAPTGSTTTGSGVDIDSATASVVIFAADVVMFHDRLMYCIERDPGALSTEEAKESANDEVIVNSLTSPGKRPLESITSMAWEQLLVQMIDCDENESSSINSTPTSQLRDRYRTQVQQNARKARKLRIARMAVLLCIFRRHGKFYASERIGDFVTIMEDVTSCLESRELHQQQFLALHLLIQIALLSTEHEELKGDLFDQYWTKVWHLLLQTDLPYYLEANPFIPQESSSELVFSLLQFCVAFGLVSSPTVMNTSKKLWEIYLPKKVSGAPALMGPLSLSSMTFLATILQVTQPPAGPATTHNACNDASPVESVRSQLLSVVFDHIQSMLSHEENKSRDDRGWNVDHQKVPMGYAAVLSSFVGICLEYPAVVLWTEPNLSIVLSNHNARQRHGPGAEFEGFGVHFSLQEWGTTWLQDASVHIIPTQRACHPDGFTPLVDFYRRMAVTDKKENRRSGEYCRFPISDSLQRRRKIGSLCFIDQAWSNYIKLAEVTMSVSREAIASSKEQIAARFTTLVDNLVRRISSAMGDFQLKLRQLNSLMTIGLILGCMYADAKDVSPRNKSVNKSLVGMICSLLNRFTGELSNHFTAAMIDESRRSPSFATSVTRQLLNLHSFIMILQGSRSLSRMKHPCADTLELRIPSELRLGIRKLVAAMEASLELIVMEKEGTSNAPASRSQSHELTSSRSQIESPSPSNGISRDWESVSTVSQASSGPERRLCAVDVDDDDDDIARPLAEDPAEQAVVSRRLLSLWCLRLILLLKRESGIKAVRQYTLELEFSPDFLLAVASMLCGVCGCESLEVIVKILDAAEEEVSRGIRHSSNEKNRAMTLLFNTDTHRILKNVSEMYEVRKSTHKEDIPEMLLSAARRYLKPSKDAPENLVRMARCAEISAIESLFRLDAELFIDFIDLAMVRILDIDFGVRLESARSLQSLFYMYPDGCDQVFRDFMKELIHCLPPEHNSRDDNKITEDCADKDMKVNLEGAEDDKKEHLDHSKDGKKAILDHTGTIETAVTVLTALYVSACSSPCVVPQAISVFVRLAKCVTVRIYRQSNVLKEWLQAIAAWYRYPSTARMFEDHFCFAWIQHFNVLCGLSTEESKKDTMKTALSAAYLLESFPVSLLVEEDDSGYRHTCADVLRRHVDVILPVAVLYDVATGSIDYESHRFPLVEQLAQLLVVGNHSTTSSVIDQQRQHQLFSFVQEQLITDLFALSFVLHASRSSAVDRDEGIVSRMLLLAEDMATTHALTLSHLGHVVMKMARFALHKMSCFLNDSESSLQSDADAWLQAMKTMKEKYSDFDWARMNLVELLTQFHELLLRSAYYEPLASQSIECFCLFVDEIKNALIVSNYGKEGVLQQLLLHIIFEVVRRVDRRDQRSSRKITFLVRDICHFFMTNATDVFGKYLNFIVKRIANLLVMTNASYECTIMSGDDRANIEWVIFAICNNLASGLGKYAVDVEPAPSNVAPCLDKLNSLLVTSANNVKTDRRKSLDSQSIVARIPVRSSDKSRQDALQQIERFVHRASRVGDRFYYPREYASNVENDTAQREYNTPGQTTSELDRLLASVRLIVSSSSRSKCTKDDDDWVEAQSIEREVLARFTRTLLMLTASDREVSFNSPFKLAIANILGEIGTWNPRIFELSPGHDSEELDRLYQRHFRRGSLKATKASFQAQMYDQLLEYLSSLLFESSNSSNISPNVLYEALNSMKNVLQIDDGKALARSKDTELKYVLEPFVFSSPSNWSLALSLQTLDRGRVAVGSLSRVKALWRAYDTADYDDWICPLTEAMAARCSDYVLRACAPLVRYRADMAVFLFPYILWAMLKNTERDPKTARLVNDSIRLILVGKAATATQARIVQLVIHSINFLRETEKALFVETNGRTQNSTGSTPTKAAMKADGRPPDSQRRLNKPAYSCLVDIDLLDIAEAAVRVEMPYSAMQFVEMWLEDRNGGVLPSLSTSTGWTTPEDRALEQRIRSILVNAHSFDDDVDAMYGVNDGRSFASQLVAYNHEGSFMQALPLYDTMMQFDDSMRDTIEGSLNALNRLGYQHLLQSHLAALSGQSRNTSQIHEHRFELAWKSLQWGALDRSIETSGANSDTVDMDSAYRHQRTLHRVLNALAHQDTDQLSEVARHAKQQILDSARSSLFGLESVKQSFAAISRLRSIREVEECAELMTDSADKVIQHFESWRERHVVQTKDAFDMTEALLSLEEVLVQVINLSESSTVLAKIHLSVSSLSRRAGRIAMSYKALMKLEELSARGHLGVYDEIEWKMERAKLLWSQNETRSAIWVAKQLQSDIRRQLASSNDARMRMQYVASLTLAGKWIASQRSENSQIIIHEYFQQATDIVDALSEDELRAAPSGIQDAAKAHMALGEYMAEMYHQVAARVSSREWLAGKRVAEARQRELAECLAMNETKQLENRAHIHALNKEVQYDYEERTKVETSVEHFLGGALRSFGRGLALSSKSELAVVFRVVSLWFNNQLKPSVNKVVQEIIQSVPSYKFVPLSYQIMSRIGSTPPSSCSARSDGNISVFERVLSMIVIKLCEQHPHHALIQLIALKNSGDVEGKGALEFRTNVGDAKSESAKKYLDKVRKGQQRELVESLDILANAYIQLALLDTRDFHKQSKKIQFAEVPIFNASGSKIPFDHCLRDRSRRTGAGTDRLVMPAVLTSSVAPRPDMDYSSVCRVLSFDPTFSITDSGIHRPKIIYCYGSDGRRFKQLVKGKDDTRQDLVIEQVFDCVNQFLKEEHNTAKRNLRLRTYKVVPLSPIAGVLEWVDNTMPWGSYLVGRVAKRLPAHERYHPHEWKHMECRMKLKNATNKFTAYKEIEANFTPVFHHFFLEKYPDPAMWYKRRLAYVQSAAVTSIVGYILGIGDRHSQNILIHEETAELVHIDFGVVFDQGMALFTPETVPFRLTRDIVDGMGVSGVDGVFTRCCEATLQLLRKKSASVVTLLEVFVHDPLYRWTLSPLKALKIQEERGVGARGGNRDGSETDEDSVASAASGTNNDAAARALIRVKQKLEGYEDPNGNALSIEGQVKQLISAAQDPHNLCALFPGWAPWL